MRSHYFAYLLVFLCLMVGVRADALSKDAQSAIEAMRVKLNAGVSLEKPVTEGAYIPGRDLAAAMERLRQQIYGIDATKVELADARPAITNELPSSEPYLVGAKLADALVKIRQSQGRTEPLHVVLAGIEENKIKTPFAAETAVLTAPAVVSPVVEVSAPPAEKAVVTPVTIKQDNLVESKKTKKAKKNWSGKKSRKGKTVKNAVVKKAVTAPAPADKTVSADNPSDKSSDAKVKSVKVESDDKDFNESIKKYDFKMPENYRIIVR